MIIIKLIFAIVFAYLYFNTVYIAVFAFAGLFAKKKSGFQVLEQKKSFVIFMPCYKGDEVIKHTAREALKVNYPKDKFRIVMRKLLEILLNQNVLHIIVILPNGI